MFGHFKGNAVLVYTGGGEISGLDPTPRNGRKPGRKCRTWVAGQPLNARQTKVLNRLLDGFEGKLTTAKWAALAKCSPDTALRDIQELVARGVLLKSDAGGRSSSYALPGVASESEKRS